MIFNRLGSIHKNQRGFTLIELVIAIAITGIITSGITVSIFQVFDMNTRDSNYMIAVRQVQNAGYWLSHDAQMAQSVVTGNDPIGTGFPLTLTWTDWETGVIHQVVYELLPSDNKLQRSYSVDGIPSGTTFAAEFVDPNLAMTNCVFPSGGTFSLPDIGDTFTITDSVGDGSGTITVTAGTVAVTFGAGTGTYDPDTGVWTTPAAGDVIIVTAATLGTLGSWTVTTGSATAAITTDVDPVGNATVATGGKLTLTVTATVGTASETRTYEVTPRPS